MRLFELIAILTTLAAVFGWANHRWIGLPTTIGIMLISLGASLVLLAVHHLGLHLDEPAAAMLAGIDFDATVLQGLLAFLLFAGALHVDLSDLAEQKLVIGLLATMGVVVSTALVGGLTWLALGLVGLSLPFLWCLVFGALISPTDPIAVLAILKSAGVPPSLETKITGESLFNDGIGVVVFLILLEIANGHAVTVGEAGLLLAREGLGGALLGFGAGLLAYAMLTRLDDYQLEVLITLALVTGGYALAGALHISGPIAVVVAGLFIGNHGRRFAMSDRTREHLDAFWELADAVLNAVLFLLIGLEVLSIRFTSATLAAGVLAIPIVLVARLVSVTLPVSMLRPFRRFSPHVIRMLTWGGLRGGISVALALSLPRGEARAILVPITYAVVVFSILVQGLSLGRVVRRSTVEE